MAFFDAAQQSAIQTAIDTDEVTADLWRSPMATSGMTSARTDTGVNVPMRVRPVGQAGKALQRIPLSQPLNAARQYYTAKIALGLDVRIGDELRVGTTRYQVEGVGSFTNAQLLALSTTRSGA